MNKETGINKSASPSAERRERTASKANVTTEFYQCSVCGELKPLVEFAQNFANSRGTGRVSRCNDCNRDAEARRRYCKIFEEKGIGELRRLESDAIERLEIIEEVISEN